MRIAIGSDHAGFSLKEQLKGKLVKEGHEVTDFGTNSPESTDYPDYAKPVGDAVVNGSADRGILVCHTGIGMSISANKIHGIRAALVDTEEAARLTREHNDANVLALGAHFLKEEQASKLVDIFLNTEFLGGRHGRRVDKMMAIEEDKPKQ